VALCDDPNEAMEYGTKRKEMGNNVGQSSLGGMAVDRYLEDEEWEKGEIRAGRGVESYPYEPQASGCLKTPLI